MPPTRTRPRGSRAIRPNPPPDTSVEASFSVEQPPNNMDDPEPSSSSKATPQALLAYTTRVKRPPNAWILYRSEKMREVLQEPKWHGRPQSEVSQYVGELWKKEPVEVKKEWEQKAEIAKQEHAEQNPGYRFQPLKKADKIKLMELKRELKEKERAANGGSKRKPRGKKASAQVQIAEQIASTSSSALPWTTPPRQDDSSPSTSYAFASSSTPSNTSTSTSLSSPPSAIKPDTHASIAARTSKPPEFDPSAEPWHSLRTGFTQDEKPQNPNDFYDPKPSTSKVNGNNSAPISSGSNFSDFLPVSIPPPLQASVVPTNDPSVFHLPLSAYPPITPPDIIDCSFSQISYASQWTEPESNPELTQFMETLLNLAGQNDPTGSGLPMPGSDGFDPDMLGNFSFPNMSTLSVADPGLTSGIGEDFFKDLSADDVLDLNTLELDGFGDFSWAEDLHYGNSMSGPTSAIQEDPPSASHLIAQDYFSQQQDVPPQKYEDVSAPSSPLFNPQQRFTQTPSHSSSHASSSSPAHARNPSDASTSSHRPSVLTIPRREPYVPPAGAALAPTRRAVAGNWAPAITRRQPKSQAQSKPQERKVSYEDHGASGSRVSSGTSGEWFSEFMRVPST
jgi:hypothetical protein